MQAIKKLKKELNKNLFNANVLSKKKFIRSTKQAIKKYNKHLETLMFIEMLENNKKYIEDKFKTEELSDGKI
jgi:hypothetical protein